MSERYEDLAKSVLEEAARLGAEQADVRIQAVRSEFVFVENKVLRSYESSESLGLSVRVVVHGSWGLASTTCLEKSAVREAVEKAFKIARSSARRTKRVELAEVEAVERSFSSPCRVRPVDVPPEEKVELLVDMNREALSVEGVKNATAYLGAVEECLYFANTEGTRLSLDRTMTGIMYSSVAEHEGRMERTWDDHSACAGWELVKEVDWAEEARDISLLAVETAKTRSPKAGAYPVVVDGRLMGLLIHEAFGHATEGDLVVSGDSVLRGRLGQMVASEQVTIVDEGTAPGGMYVPFDDEGVLKGRTVVVERGVLRSFLTSREVAAKLSLPPTGNGRAQDFANFPIVRQTNYYMEPGGYALDELVEDIKFGYFLKGRSRRGGEVNPGMGTFTFRAGPSHVIRNGEICELVRGVAMSGDILEALRLVEAVGREVELRTSVFGGCGKYDQTVRVGLGGPSVRIGRMVVGGA